MNVKLHAQDIPAGSYLINMGITPQTVGNGLKPYGLVYALLQTHSIPVYWYINPAKAKDGIDFTHNAVSYRGGVFVIFAGSRTPAVNATIASFTSMGVVGATSTSLINTSGLDVYKIGSSPNWTLDRDNGSIAAAYFVKAGIPSSAHGGSSSSNWKRPSELNCCDDLFVMPHADPVWSTHQRLFTWNLDCKGSIWAACHAISALENMVNPALRTQQTNFLTQKDPAWTGAAGNYSLSNSLILWGSHLNGSPPYLYRLNSDPIAQFMGIVDGATINGSEQIVIPRQGIVANASTYSPSAVARWNPGASTIVYDPTQANVTNPDLTTFRNVASLMTYGRGFDSPSRGYVMYQPAHDHNGTAPANIAAQRAFFNYSFFVLRDKGKVIDLAAIPSTIATGTPTTLMGSIVTAPDGAGPFTVTWSSNCGGSFAAPNPNSVNGAYPLAFSKVFTPPTVASATPCIITVIVTDACGRKTVETRQVTIIPCQLAFNNTITNVTCNGLTNGNISMSITGGAGPYTWNWSRVSPAGTGMGGGTLISGLSAGTYNVTVTAPGNCSGTFTTLISQPNVITATATPSNYLCFGQRGSINVSVTGGTPAYTYTWSDAGPSTNPRTNLLAGSYTVTVTDMNGCTRTASATVTGPTTPLAVSSTKTNVSCNGGTNGTIDLNVSGGTPGYTYAWSGSGSGIDPRTNLAAGIYTATITDINGCTITKTDTITQPPILVISLLKTDPTCPPGANPVNNNGAITVTASGGTAGYQVVWTGPPSGNPPGVEIATSGGNYNIPNLPVGTYTVTVTDVNGCLASLMITLNALNALPNQPTGINNN